MENHGPVLSDEAKFEIEYHCKDFIAAKKTLDTIIHNTMSRNLHHGSNKKLLIVYLIKRIKLNFDIQNYHDVIEDCGSLENLGEDINKEKDLFLMKEQAILEKNIEEANKRLTS